MLPRPLKAVLDANVLFPFSLRDTLLRLAAEDLYQPYWSAQILMEARRNLISTQTINEDQADRLMAAMRRAFPEAVITGHEPHIANMPNQEKDRHVAAAAVQAEAQVIVTSNLKDFRRLPEGIQAQSPDDFLCNLFEWDPDGVAYIIQRQAAALKHPPRSFSDLLRGLAKTVPKFANAIRIHTGLLP